MQCSAHLFSVRNADFTRNSEEKKKYSKFFSKLKKGIKKNTFLCVET